MHQSNSLIIHNDGQVIFETVANLDNWTRLLPHYRWIRTVEGSGDDRIVHMAAFRGWIPIQWTSRFKVERDKREIHFEHLKAFTKSMVVVWTFTGTPDGVLVRIDHDLKPRWPIVGKFIADRIIGGVFIHHVASKTLEAFKQHLDSDASEFPAPEEYHNK